MRVGVIRGDLPGPLFLADLEPTSQTNFPVDPAGQTQYAEYPNSTVLTNFLAGLDPNGDPAKYQGSGGVPAGVSGSTAGAAAASPRLRPMVQLIPPVSRMRPATFLPTACSSTGRQGTSVKSRVRSMRAYFVSPIWMGRR